MTQEPFRGAVFLLLAKWLKQLKLFASPRSAQQGGQLQDSQDGSNLYLLSGVAGPRGLVILFNKIKVWYFSVSQNWT